MSTLANIRTKVRRLTSRPSPQQITDAEIDEYVNTFYIYDLPEHLREFTLDSTFEFMTTPNVDKYDLSTLQVSYSGTTESAVNVYYNIKPPAYVAGYQALYSQSLSQFFGIYPRVAQINTSLTGDGTSGPYSVTMADTPILQNSVSIGAIDSTNAIQTIVDVPVDYTTGTLETIDTNVAVVGSVNYLTGAISVTFPATISSGTDISVQATPYVASRPLAVLFHNDVITLRPVPDQSYKVTLSAFIIPTKLLSAGQSPELKQWWQYLAYGAAKKILEDTGDQDGVKAIYPEYKEMEALVGRRTLVQQTPERTATIYTEITSFGYGNWGNRF